MDFFLTDFSEPEKNSLFCHGVTILSFPRYNGITMGKASQKFRESYN